MITATVALSVTMRFFFLVTLFFWSVDRVRSARATDTYIGKPRRVQEQTDHNSISSDKTYDDDNIIVGIPYIYIYLYDVIAKEYDSRSSSGRRRHSRYARTSEIRSPGSSRVWAVYGGCLTDERAARETGPVKYNVEINTNKLCTAGLERDHHLVRYSDVTFELESSFMDGISFSKNKHTTRALQDHGYYSS